MKSAHVEDNVTDFYDHCLIYTDAPVGRREALALFREMWDTPEFLEKAQNDAGKRLAEIVYDSLEVSHSGLDTIRLAMKPENLNLVKNIKIETVRLVSNLSNYDDGKEKYYFWDFGAKLIHPFRGGVGVIPSEFPYTITQRSSVTRSFGGIFPTIGKE